MFLRLCILLTLLFSGPLSFAEPNPNINQPSPFDEWQRLSTAHFVINFQLQHHAMAQRMLAIAEHVHAQVAPVMQWKSKDKVEVVILDSTDASNGYATPVPYNRFVIYMPAPEEGALADNNAWLERVFIHEYTHVLHTDQAGAFSVFWRSVFGRTQTIPGGAFVFPQALAPSWLLEGIAVYNETKFPGGFGRLNGAYYDALLRLEVDKGLQSLTVESFEGRNASRWPLGQVYFYGAFFMQFLSENYGEAKLYDYINHYRENIIPWQMDSRASDEFDIGGVALWHEFEVWAQARTHAQATLIAEQGVMSSQLMADRPYNNRYLAVDESGGAYYYHADAEHYPAVSYVDQDGDSHDIKRLLAVRDLSYRPGHDLLVVKTEICEGINQYSDLYALNSQGKLRRLTHCGRFVHAVWSAQSMNILAVQNAAGRKRLVLINGDGDETVLSELAIGDVIGNIDWAPDGSWAVAAVKRQATGWNLERFDLTTREWEMLTHNNDIALRPKIDSAHNRIIYLSDHDKRINARSLDLDTRRISSLTNTQAYLTDVALSGNALWFGAFSTHNVAIRRMPLRTFGHDYPADGGEAAIADKSFVNSDDFVLTDMKAAKNYSALSSLRPRSWTPIVRLDSASNNAFGFKIDGSDILGFHQWSVAPIYYSQSNTLGGIATYNWYKRFLVAANNGVSTLSVANADLGVAASFEEKNQLQALARWDYSQLAWNMTFKAGGGSRFSRQFDRAGSLGSDNSLLAGGVFEFANTRRYLNSISIDEGLDLTATADYEDAGNNEASGAVYGATQRLDMDVYVPLWGLNVLKVSASQALSQGTLIQPFGLGGSSDSLADIGSLTGLGQRDFALRGYDKGLPELQGDGFSKLAAEWRAPIARVYNGFFLPPVGIGKSYFRVFGESAQLQNKQSLAGVDANKIYSSAGIELGGELQIGYDNLIIDITAGIAQGLDENIGGTQYYIQTSSSF